MRCFSFGNRAGGHVVLIVFLLAVPVSLATAETHITRGFFAGYVHQWQKRPEALAAKLLDVNANAVCLCPGNAAISYRKGDGVCKFLDVMHDRGISVATYMLPRFPPFNQIPSCRGPFEHCPIGQFSTEWEKVLTEIAKYPYDEITVVPDEWYWSPFAYFPECVAEFRKRYGTDADPKASRRAWAQFCYSLSRERAQAWAACVKRTNPRAETSVLLSMNPVLAGRRVQSGVAWDDIGYVNGIDKVTSDPYLVLHGASSHWYVPEATKHLIAASSRRSAEVVLQCMQHREHQRELLPVEVYGSALSALACGANGIWFFGLQQIIGESAPPQKGLAAKYHRCKETLRFIKGIESWLDGASVPKSVAVLYSRNSEDFYTGVLGSRTAYLARKGIVSFLLRNCYPFQMFALEKVRDEDLTGFEVLILPFPYYLPRKKLEVVERFVRGGGDLIVTGELGAVDESFRDYDSPALAEVLGIKSLSPPVFGALSFLPGSPVLGGKTIDLGQQYGFVQLVPAEGTTVISRVRGKMAGVSVCDKYPGKTIYVNSFSLGSGGAVGELTRGVLDYVLRGKKVFSITKGRSDDIEVHLLNKGDNERLVVAANWMKTAARLQLRIPGVAGSEVCGRYMIEGPGEDLEIGDTEGILRTGSREERRVPEDRPVANGRPNGGGSGTLVETDLLDVSLLPYEAKVLRLRKRPE